MFSNSGLFQKIACPDKSNCKRSRCIFSHQGDIPLPLGLQISVKEPKAQLSQPTPPISSKTIPAKRPIAHSNAAIAGPSTTSYRQEPPRKLQKLGPTQKQAPITKLTYTSTGVPLLKVNAAQSQVAVPVRQAMVKSLYDHFMILYEAILSENSTLASEHALQQEVEVYKSSSKMTYRNAVINSIAAIKRRSKPDSIAHASVGTEADVAAKEESRKSLNSLRLTQQHLDHLKMSEVELRNWGYIMDIPDGPGGTQPSAVGKTQTCDRCKQTYLVVAHSDDSCHFHYGKQFTRKVNGERTRLYTCCSQQVAEGGGCIRGPHVFYETDPAALHSRHAFTPSRVANAERGFDTALDVAAIDCEMIYTTGGMRCARVSVVDGSGKEVFDEFVRMDEEVDIIDYNTRFSGISEETYKKALLPLTSIRKSLDAFINSATVLIGHALDNDLKTLRMIHQECVDSVMLFPHVAGPPYRKSLKDLVKEYLGTVIQAGGATVGHSSVEDSIATLDLIRWYVLNKPKTRRPTAITASPKKPDPLPAKPLFEFDSGAW